ncbi:MAG TPA: ISL3 family transposase [Sporichthyaceae bacterium]
MVDRSDDASCLLGLAGLAVEGVVRTSAGVTIVQLVTDDPDAARCPVCRETSSSGKDWVLTRPKDLPCGGAFMVVQWRKRRRRCRTEDCPRQTFTEQVAQVPAGMRTTTRLRAALAAAVEDGRDQSEVAASHQVSWPTVQRAVVSYGASELVEPEPTTVLGMDETRFGRPRWVPDGVHVDGRIRWKRTDPWETGFVDITGDQGLLGQVDGRTSTAVKGWLKARSQAFRDGVDVVVIDPHAGYAAAVREVLPDAALAVDHFHLIMLANKAVTTVRQRVTREQLGRRGRALDPAWANRRLLLRGSERLSERALARMWNGCVDHDSTGQILTAWIAKEELRALCATAAHGGHREDIARRLWAFYSWCADADVPELTTLAETIETWWPAIEVFLTTGLTNARTEGTNRLIKQVKRAACGFRNRDNYRRRVRLHCTRRTRRLSARKPTVPAQS